MSDYNYGGWGHFGFAANDSIDLDTSYDEFILEKDASVKRSQGIPDDAHIYDILFEFSSMATSGATPTQVSFYLARDAAGTKPLTQIFTTSIIKALGAAAATGGARQKVEVDFHSTSPVGPSKFNSIYVIAKVDASTADATAYLSWRS
jgi:hypothetical protein